MPFSVIGSLINRLRLGTYSLAIPGGIWACEVPLARIDTNPAVTVQYRRTNYVWLFERDYREEARMVLTVYSSSASGAEILAREMIDQVLDQPLVLNQGNTTFQIYPDDFRLVIHTDSDFEANRVYRCEVDLLVQINRNDAKPGS